MTRPKTRHLVLRVEEETLESLKEEADSLGISISEVARSRISSSVSLKIMLSSIEKKLDRLAKDDGKVQGQ